MRKKSNDEDLRETAEDEIDSLDEVFDILVSPQRRAALYALCKRSKLDVEVLVDAIVASETTDEGICREQLGIALTHIHLPKLEQVGLVAHDPETETVELKTVPRRFKRYLRVAARDEIEECTEELEA